MRLLTPESALKWLVTVIDQHHKNTKQPSLADEGLYEAVAFFFKHHPPVLPGVKPFEWCRKYEGTGADDPPSRKAKARKTEGIEK